MQESRIYQLLEEISREIKTAEKKHREAYASAIDVDDEEASMQIQAESFAAIRRMKGLVAAMEVFRAELDKSGILKGDNNSVYISNEHGAIKLSAPLYPEPQQPAPQPIPQPAPPPPIPAPPPPVPVVEPTPIAPAPMPVPVSPPVPVAPAPAPMPVPVAPAPVAPAPVAAETVGFENIEEDDDDIVLDSTDKPYEDDFTFGSEDDPLFDPLPNYIIDEIDTMGNIIEELNGAIGDLRPDPKAEADDFSDLIASPSKPFTESSEVAPPSYMSLLDEDPDFSVLANRAAVEPAPSVPSAPAVPVQNEFGDVRVDFAPPPSNAAVENPANKVTVDIPQTAPPLSFEEFMPSKPAAMPAPVIEPLTVDPSVAPSFSPPPPPPAPIPAPAPAPTFTPAPPPPAPQPQPQVPAPAPMPAPLIDDLSFDIDPALLFDEQPAPVPTPVAAAVPPAPPVSDDDFSGFGMNAPDVGIYTNRTPNGFIMFGRRVDTKDWADMLTKVCEILILKNPYTVAQFNNYPDLNPFDNCYFSYNQGDIKSKPKKLSNGLFIEIDRKPDDIVMLCKKILELCGYPRSELEIEFND